MLHLASLNNLLTLETKPRINLRLYIFGGERMDQITTKSFSTVGELVAYLQAFCSDTMICGIGGGCVTITEEYDCPDRLWFE